MIPSCKHIIVWCHGLLLSLSCCQLDKKFSSRCIHWKEARKERELLKDLNCITIKMDRSDDFSENSLEADRTIKERRDAEHQRYSTLLNLQALSNLTIFEIKVARSCWNKILNDGEGSDGKVTYRACQWFSNAPVWLIVECRFSFRGCIRINLR